ncbi:hypothetical protein UY3_06128 [Chelonia mydas]|uniref:Uncharacterized protein n=1 Tax=Chelonia mydas TaxID=8469 RepID=M7C828_CHEMY|nr:hypothetical protein UY3_06128 [Chelonia mydas]
MASVHFSTGKVVQKGKAEANEGQGNEAAGTAKEEAPEDPEEEEQVILPLYPEDPAQQTPPDRTLPPAPPLPPEALHPGQARSRSRCHTMASLEPAEPTAAIVSIVNTLRIILKYVQNRAKRRQHEDDCDEDMDTDVPESTDCGNWDIMVAVGLVDTVEH